MKQSLKRCEEWAISLKHNVFLWARLKLTFLYVLIIAFILIGFSLALYTNISKNLIDIGEETFAGPEAHQHFLHETLEATQDEILAIDLIVLIVSAGLGFLLAGYTLRPIQRSVEAQRMFSENASHELRTPLAVMKNEIEVLLHDPNPDKERIVQTLKSSVEEIDHMTRMAEDLLLLARADNKKELFLTRVDAGAIVKQVINSLKSIASLKEISLHHTLKDEFYIEGNNDALRRVFINILKNSIDHTSKGGTITVEGDYENGKCLLSFIDTGSGINEKDLPHVFERFYKGAGTSGTGLGLSIVKELVQKQNGEVVIQSEKNKGTKVILRFPHRA
ncbi:MAG: histidine kinase [Candidatus Taylorbacteria bacterium]|nr:histidine kinase [Candidatus Taylorbacteria bacterium]